MGHGLSRSSRIAVRVTGVVQGVGYRPFAVALADRLGLTGLVGNDAAGVFIEVQGDEARVEEFVGALRIGPPMAEVDDVATAPLPDVEEQGFRIVPSTSADGTTSIPPDTATCADCLNEMRDPADRRFGYPFIACTNCGPRYTIVTGLPYDRPFTTMADFPLCPDCRAEYEDPRSRRFHAQPTACAACGPRLSVDVGEVAAWLQDGLVVAIKGVGGYHLACDATNREAVRRLRDRKQRGDKPFAVMAADLEQASAVARLDDTAVETLLSPARPIVLAPSLDASLQDAVALGNAYLVVMLPYAPLHHLLFDAGAPLLLVMTSGNLSDEPICTEADEATERLAGIADAMVHHDRRIHVACDDSVVRASAIGLQPVRRSRGYAPLPLALPMETPALAAVGGEIKTTACVAHGRQAWLSQHIGDTQNLETLDLLARTVGTLAGLQRISPEAIISDAHPGYLSRRWAHEEAIRRGVPHLTVQHHHAHLGSLLAEHQWPADKDVLGFAFDGTGYGGDGTIWGGELLLGGYASVERIGHLAEVPLPGGDSAIHRPLRTALAHLHAAGVPLDRGLAPVDAAEAGEVAIIERMLVTGAGCARTTSVGRLFDAVAAVLDVRQSVDYEGQAAIELEALAALEAGAPSVPLDAAAWAPQVHVDGDRIVLDPAPTMRAAVAAARSGMPRGVAARLFHEGLADAVLEAAVTARGRTKVTNIGLTGGVFANAVLTEACQGRLGREGFTVLIHRRVPPNDGGLALGQVAVAAAGGAREGT